MSPAFHAGECDECGHPLAGMVATPYDDPCLRPTVKCDECGDATEYGVVTKPRRCDDDRWYPGLGDSEAMHP